MPFSTRPDAVLSFSDITTYAAARQVGAFATEHRLVWMPPFREMTAAGGLLSFGPNLVNVFAHSATFVAKILAGAKPRTSPWKSRGGLSSSSI